MAAAESRRTKQRRQFYCLDWKGRSRSLSTESLDAVAFRGECRALAAWTILRLVFLKKPHAKLEQGIRGFRAVALLSVLAKWYAAFLVGLLHKEPEPMDCKELHAGDERGIDCEHQWHRE